MYVGDGCDTQTLCSFEKPIILESNHVRKVALTQKIKLNFNPAAQQRVPQRELEPSQAFIVLRTSSVQLKVC